jgi:hypothetical protein
MADKTRGSFTPLALICVSTMASRMALKDPSGTAPKAPASGQEPPTKIKEIKKAEKERAAPFLNELMPFPFTESIHPGDPGSIERDTELCRLYRLKRDTHVNGITAIKMLSILDIN